MFVTGSQFETGILGFQLGSRRRRAEEDIENPDSSLPPTRIKKTCLTIDLTKGLGEKESPREGRSLSVENEYPHDMSSFQIQPRALSTLSHEQHKNHGQPSSRVAFDNELAEWYKGSKSLPSLKTGMFDIPGLGDWSIGSSDDSRSPTPGVRLSSPSPAPAPSPLDHFRPFSGMVSSSTPRQPTGINLSTPSRKRAIAKPLPPPEEYFDEEEIDAVVYKGHTFRARKAVEFDDGTFMRIRSILNRTNDDGEEEVFLRGAKYKRARDFMGLLGLKKNEVALCAASETIPLSKIIRTRILIMTNAAFPKYRDVHGNAQADEIEGRLICRWKLTIVSKQESYIRRLGEQEADKEFRAEDRQLREDWRGGIVKFTEVLKVTSRDHFRPQRRPELVGGGANSNKVASSEIGRRVETHHTEIVANGSSIELKETSFELYPRGDSSVLGRRTYEATVDSRTPSGRFLGHFQGTYTPNSFPSPSLCNNSQPSSAGKFSLASSPPSVAAMPRLYSGSIRDSDTRSPGKAPIDPRSGFEILGKDLGCFMPSGYGNSRRPSLLANATLQESSNRGSPENPRSLKKFDKILTEPPPPQPALVLPQRSEKKRYRFGDAFCGGGGMSSGARSAGLINAWSFDSNEDAINTYRRNFPDCETYHASANDFVTLPPEELLVDVVHLSPPCQPHSPAHTIAGKDDDRNEASLFCVKECLEAARPRMVTLEQTDGILNRQEWFRSMVLCFTDLGFSVSWKVLHGVEYGVPQTRKRLFLLAASPGEALPNFPAPRFSHPRAQETSKLPPPRTVRDAIGSIPFGVSSHEPTLFPGGPRQSPVDFDQPLRATILASGGPYDVHPSGMRPFTPRELACLQTFPITHDFQGSPCQRKKQIGNAVPPKLAEALLKEVRRTLERVDREREKAKKAENTASIEAEEEEDVIYEGSKQVECPMEEVFPDIVYNRSPMAREKTPETVVIDITEPAPVISAPVPPRATAPALTPPLAFLAASRPAPPVIAPVAPIQAPIATPAIPQVPVSASVPAPLTLTPAPTIVVIDGPEDEMQIIPVVVVD